MKIEILTLVLIIHTLQAGFNQLSGNPTAHGDLVITASIYNDNSRYVTGSNDNTVKIWSMADHSLITTLTYSDFINNVGLHPITNDLYILVNDGTISIVDSETYL